MSALRLNALLEKINDLVSVNLTYPKAKFYEQAELQEKNDRTFPMINNGSRLGYKISPDSAIALQSYHRVLSSITETDYEKGKGKYPYQERVYTIRNVWIGSLNKLPGKPYESNDDVKNDVVNAFPVNLESKELIKITTENINKQEILDEEFAGVETKSLILELIVFYIEYEIRQKIKCN